MSPAGYSGTALAKKLGIKSGFKIELINTPDYYMDLFEDELPDNLDFSADADQQKDLIHFFTKSNEEYQQFLPLLREQINYNGMIWVSWPKKSSGLKSDISENQIRDFAIQSGLVDIKVCAVDQTWSGLKLVIPVKYRK